VENDELMDFARALVQAKAGQAGPDEKELMAKELRVQIEDMINRELLSRMDGPQIVEFRGILEQEADFTPEKMLDFIKNCDIDINNVTTVALAKVKFAYLGT